VLRLAGRPVPGPAEAVVKEAAALVGFPATELEPLVRRSGTGERLAPAYLAALARTAEYVNSLT
jgi:hypothetical protein